MPTSRGTKSKDERKDTAQPESEEEAKAKGRDPQQAKGQSDNKKGKSNQTNS